MVEEETDSDDSDEFVGNTFLGGDARNHIAIRRDRGDDDDDDDIAADEELELPVNVRFEVSIGDEGPELEQTE